MENAKEEYMFINLRNKFYFENGAFNYTTLSVLNPIFILYLRTFFRR